MMTQTVIKILRFFKQTSLGYRQLIFSFFCLWLMMPGVTSAASSEFNIRALVGEDTTPPTTPVLLEVVPVAPTQIDVTWSASTDNVIMGGYVLLRDSLPIATTTLTSFIDIGLTPETLYTYEVYAFDYVGNVSTTSNALATTTPALMVLPTTPTTTSSSATRIFRLNNLDINTGTNNAFFTWETSLVSRFALRWGRSDAYSEGYIINDVFRTEHQTSVSGLEPGTIYLYELIGYMVSGREVVLSSGEFKTKARENTIPVNVFGLSYQINDQAVALSWSRPTQIAEATVRVVRNHLSYPTDPYDGAIVYEGKKNNFYDLGALEFYSTQYYTVFVIGSDGSISSGAVLKVSRPLSPGAGVGEIEVPEINLPDFDFNRANIIISQGALTYNFDSVRIVLSSADTFLISIPYLALPRHLKSIVATILDPTDHQRGYSFLLRINKERTAYEASVAPFAEAGVSRLEIEIFDFEAEVVGRYRKQIDFVYRGSNQNEVIFPDKIVALAQPVFLLVGFFSFCLLSVFLFVFRRRRQAEDKH